MQNNSSRNSRAGDRSTARSRSRPQRLVSNTCSKVEGLWYRIGDRATQVGGEAQRKVVRVPGDPLGTMEGEQIIYAGTGAQINSYGDLGDYSAVQPDYGEDCTFGMFSKITMKRFSRPRTILDRFYRSALRPSDTHCSTLIGFVGMVRGSNPSLASTAVFVSRASRPASIGRLVMHQRSVTIRMLRTAPLASLPAKFYGRSCALFRTSSGVARSRKSSVRFRQRTTPKASTRNSAGRAMSFPSSLPPRCSRS